MEVDELGSGGGSSGDPENQLVNMFSSMATEDKDNLVKALQAIVGTSVSPANCQFFLELANWNLSGAIGAYYDFDFSQQQQQPQQQLLRQDLVATDTSGPRLAILSCEAVVCEDSSLAVSCTVYNESTNDCPPGCRLVCCPESADASGGAYLCEPCQLPIMRPGSNCSCRFILPPLLAGALNDLANPGRRVRLRLVAPDGLPLTLPASTRCLDLVDLAMRGRGGAESGACADAASRSGADSPVAVNPPPSPSHADENMMD
ncbi:hypothetical protein BOX15_Mlig016595g4 [Macrostomum lignano]|uniref:Uncharacterized protein n=2 Tax=Macrostomum lignano TaxID=282301 RepID=A0A267G1R3_9PLAT|nr:hypothetical protein BOX15_Mlig016595g4 [Macrostomum lignano]